MLYGLLKLFFINYVKITWTVSNTIIFVLINFSKKICEYKRIENPSYSKIT